MTAGMSKTPERYLADIEGLRLIAFVSRNYGSWSAAVYDLDKKRYVWEREPLPPAHDSEESAKKEAVSQAAVRLGKSPDELSPVWVPVVIVGP